MRWFNTLKALKRESRKNKRPSPHRELFLEDAVRVSRTSCFLLLSILLLAPLTEARGQTILVQVTEDETGQPISGAFLSLLRADGALVRHALTNDQGRFLFAAPDAGPFTIQAEMIGRETRQVPNLVPGLAGGRSVELSLPVRAIELEGIQVQAEARCQLRPEEATTTAKVWEEARKALVVQQWAERERVLEFGVVSYSRDLDPRTLQVLSEERRGSRAVSQNPIQSLAPEVLVQDGFVQQVEDGQYDFYAPDPRVLLSDPFLDTHCLQVTNSSQHPGLVGLQFEPVNPGGPPDIEGVLWVARENWRLRALDFAYTWSPYDQARGRARGRVEFEALPSGAWVVRKWWIRMPAIAQRTGVQRWGGDGFEVIGYREVGGEIEEISTLNRVSLIEASWATLTGTVWDSTRAQPLENAQVYLRGTGYSIRTDSEGHFELSGLPEGRYTAMFLHPRLDSLDVAMEGAEVRLAPGTRTDVTMTIPSRETLAASLCEGLGYPRESGTIVGMITAGETGGVLPGSRIQVTWDPSLSGYADGNGGSDHRDDILTFGERIGLETASNLKGWYTACGVPSDLEVEVLAERRGDASEAGRVILEPGEIRRLDLRIH